MRLRLARVHAGGGVDASDVVAAHSGARIAKSGRQAGCSDGADDISDRPAKFPRRQPPDNGHLVAVGSGPAALPGPHAVHHQHANPASDGAAPRTGRAGAGAGASGSSGGAEASLGEGAGTASSPTARPAERGAAAPEPPVCAPSRSAPAPCKPGGQRVKGMGTRSKAKPAPSDAKQRTIASFFSKHV